MDEMPVETTLYSLSDRPPSRPDRREGERHLSLFRVGSVSIDDRRELCLIKNVSSGGMLIRAYCQITPGTRLAIELKEGQNVTGTARWANGDTVGIAFDEPIDVVALLATSMDGPRPRMPRIEIRCFASVRDDGRIYRLWTRDISQGGVKVESRQQLPVGRPVVVTMPGIDPQPGVVRWEDSGCFGITFNKLIPLPQLVCWLQQQQDRLRAVG